MSFDYLENLRETKKINLDDLAITIDLFNTMVKLGMGENNSLVIEDLQSQLDIIKYRSFQTINDTYGGNV